jgi:acetolactate synthase-1/2/3 large subunit
MSALYALAEDIAGRGVPHIFGIPGSGPSLTLLDALEKRGVPFYLTHFEGTAALMAGTVGRLSGRAGAAISIKGPGLANMVPGLAACRLETLPVVSISEAYLPGTSPSKAHKRMDHDGLVLSVAKGRRFLSKKGPRFSDLANWAEAEVPGPVHLDVAESAIENDAPIPDVPQHQHGGVHGSACQELFDLVAAADRSVLIAGTLSLRKKLSSHLNQLSVPVFSVAAAKGVIDETLSHAAGVYTGTGLELTPEFSILRQADLVIGIGLRHNEVLAVKPFPCKAISLDPLGHTLCRGFHFDHVFDGTLEEIEAVFTALGDKRWGMEGLSRCFEKMRKKMLAGQFMPASAFQVIEQHLQHRARLVLDTGNFCTIGEHIWRVPKPEWYLASGQARYMGVGLPMALGAAIYDPGIPTVAFLGDGGIGMFIADIKMAVKHHLPLTVVLMSDGYFGSIRMRSIKDGLTEVPTTIYQPSWVKAVECFGVHAARAKDEAEIETVLKSWNPSLGPLFIEIPFDPESYQHMVANIR